MSRKAFTNNNIDVHYFEQPTIGYCPECGKAAVWDNVRGLYCPKCKAGKSQLAIFVWDKHSRYPE